MRETTICRPRLRAILLMPSLRCGHSHSTKSLDSGAAARLLLPVPPDCQLVSSHLIARPLSCVFAMIKRLPSHLFCLCVTTLRLD
ncbi:hypothetical protein CABS01_00065 [Colletotrichum abscissum]|uniref:uncharacterized protein n=1 Tax=Colletotrichum abscissum TaxID=1671311 RepID=UPI0027D4A920|nr:uncharacterized protein CABS01_00065 [Colletotrichum abscissum]KAI3539162.1 hypothetical protein CSPX01_09061 [Colletotrichum filicis]KAK1524976.1 hypothetical protein CABS01_00065 [Colletotrichum abscissum]